MNSLDPVSFTPAPAAAPDGYRDALAAYIAGTNTYDFDHVRPLLHPDVVFRFSDTDCTTLLAARHYFENTWSVVQDEHYEAGDVAWRVPTPTTAIASYTYRWAGVIDGERRSGSGRATNVFVTGADGRWVLAHEHLSPSPSHGSCCREADPPCGLGLFSWRDEHGGACAGTGRLGRNHPA